MMDWIIWSTTSDFCATRPSVLEWMKNQAGHIAIGMVLGLTALLSRPLAAIVFAGLLGKELAYDMPDCDVQTVIVLDSPCDLGFYLLGIQLALFLDGKMPAAASMLIDINANGRTPSLPHHSAPPMRSTEQSIAVLAISKMHSLENERSRREFAWKSGLSRSVSRRASSMCA